MNIKEKYEMLKRLELTGIDNLQDFKKRVLMGKHNECDDELYQNGMWDFAYELGDTLVSQDKDNELLGVELLYNLLKY